MASARVANQLSRGSWLPVAGRPARAAQAIKVLPTPGPDDAAGIVGHGKPVALLRPFQPDVTLPLELGCPGGRGPQEKVCGFVPCLLKDTH